ncbi:hypothetical protein CFD26_104082 [Aspergillus turcosus]|uniref:F-box domain-containing protein n=1 Tax=Aspergillus turcosus TaxID=1245748 RepID=A0A3R7IH71_9EURO|nr:hypothetical protein CFD26_104082 [Aspergillus turcosus]
MSLADLPTEILVQVFASLDSLRDAVNLSKTCSRFDLLLNDTWNMATIFDAIADNIVLPETPDAAWLETHFGRDCLWKPLRSQISPGFSHAQTLEFLTTIGFPDCSMGVHGIDLQHFRKNIEQDTDDEQVHMYTRPVVGMGYTSGVSTWEECYILGFVGDQRVIVSYKSGLVGSYNPSARGIYHDMLEATCIMSFLVILGTVMSSRNAIKELMQRSSDPLKLAMGVWCLEKIYLKMKQYDLIDTYSHLWWDILFDGVGYTDYFKGPQPSQALPGDYLKDTELVLEAYLLGLPNEVLLHIFGSAESLRDVVNLARTCTRLDHLYRDETNLKIILDSIAANIVMPKNPDSTWLKTHFRVENLQTPDDSVLAAIEHVETRIFLSTVGFPDCSTRTGGLSSQRMSTVGIDGSTLNDPDIRDEDPPPLAGNYFLFDSASEFGMLFGTVKGDVIFCLFQGPGGTPCTDKHLSLGSAATSVSSFLVLLGTFLKFRRQVYEVMDLWTLSEVLPRLPIYEAFLRRVYERMREYGNLPERYDSFWHDICGNFSLCSPSFKKLVMRISGRD